MKLLLAVTLDITQIVMPWTPPTIVIHKSFAMCVLYMVYTCMAVSCTTCTWTPVCRPCAYVYLHKLSTGLSDWIFPAHTLTIQVYMCACATIRNFNVCPDEVVCWAHCPLMLHKSQYCNHRLLAIDQVVIHEPRSPFSQKLHMYMYT